MKVAFAALFLALYSSSCDAVEYGADCSFAIVSNNFQCGDLLGDKAAFYEEYMQGCRNHYAPNGDACDRTEQDRLARSQRQPQSMVNYTSTGYLKIKAPENVMKIINEFWETNRFQGEPEVHGLGDTYGNHWEAEWYVVSIDNPKHPGGGPALRDSIWDAAKSTIEEWTGMEQLPSSLYGIRVYTGGAVLSPHVDRLPLVSSAIVNVAQDVDEPWPLEVYGRDGKAVNITMEPGDMVLYESGSLIHGRPFPLVGRFFANIFIHFEPSGRPVSEKTDNFEPGPDVFYPPYVIPDSPALPKWKQDNPYGWRKAPAATDALPSQYHPGHKAAAMGDVELLLRMARENHAALHVKDENGWQPIHQAVRAGHLSAVKFLLEHGADINGRTNEGKGYSPLSIALGAHSENHPVTQFLRSVGAMDLGAEL